MLKYLSINRKNLKQRNINSELKKRKGKEGTLNAIPGLQEEGGRWNYEHFVVWRRGPTELMNL